MFWTKAIAALFASILTVLTHLAVDFLRRIWLVKVILPCASTWVDALRSLGQSARSFFRRVEVRVSHVELPFLKIGFILAFLELLGAGMLLLVALERLVL